MTTPECAKWKMWVGPEVEGHSELGEQTLFIRDLATTAQQFSAQAEELVPRMTKNGTIRRVWFCKEFVNWPLLREISRHFRTSCLEVTPKTYGNVPRDLMSNCVIYLKITDFFLKPGDHVCVGPNFQDEAFKIGTGAKVSPESYAGDRKLL